MSADDKELTDSLRRQDLTSWGTPIPPRIPTNHPKHPDNKTLAELRDMPVKEFATQYEVELGDAPASDPFNRQVGGNHYKDCKIQPVEYIVANDLDFCCGNVVKYVTRFKVKGNVQDLLKAKHYIELKLASLGETTLPPCTAVG